MLKNLAINIKREHRIDIIGLRGLACLAIILFHYFPNIFKGGFLGVDIFFVISGFVISKSLLNNSLTNGTINVFDFWARRIRRIFPALIFLLFAVLLAGYVLLTYREMVLLGKSIIAGVFGVENIYLLQSAGYFDISANFKPLLHLWALEIEEQFYFIYPLVLCLSYKVFNKKSTLVYYLTLLSFVYYVFITFYNYNSIYFYFSPLMRLWELLIGGCVAYSSIHLGKDKILGVLNRISILIIFVIISVFFFSSMQLFFIGVIGEYLGEVLTQVLHRPVVIEKERINF